MVLRRRDDTADADPAATPAIAQALLGPVLLGDALQLILFGLLLAVFASWLSTGWSRASRLTRSITTLVFVLTAFETALNIADIWHFGTLQQRSAGDLLTGTAIEATEPLLVGLIGSLVESVLVLRASKLIQSDVRKWAFICFTGTLSLVGLLGSIGATVWGLLYYFQPFLESPFTPTFNQCIAVWLWCSASADACITITFVLTFRQRLAGFNDSTDSVIRKICNGAIRSAAYTAFFAVPGAILSVVYNGEDLMTTDIAYAFWIPLPGLYALSLFSTLTAPSRLSSHLRGVTSAAPAFPPPRGSRPALQTKHSRSFSSLSPDLIEQRRSRVDAVNVQVELWVQEELSEDRDQIELGKHSGSQSQSADPEPGHLCPA